MGLLTYVNDEEGYIRTVGPQYLTYITYQALGGTLDEATFDNFEYEAETLVNWYTFNRLKNENPENYPVELERCVFQLVNLIQLKQDAMGITGSDSSSGGTGVIASQSNDGVSVSYNILSAKEILDLNNVEARKIVDRYLQGVTNSLGQKLLYRGLYPNE